MPRKSNTINRLLVALALLLMNCYCNATVQLFISDFESEKTNNSNTNTSSVEAVDLGLSVKWASCNVGANSPEESGAYFAWGETEEKEQYDWTTYRYTEQGATKMTKYCFSSLGSTIDLLDTLEPIDDAATVNLGEGWRTPSLDELNELIQNCIKTWISNYNNSGKSGYLFTSMIPGFTENSIFLPAAGHKGGRYLYDDKKKGMYWTSTLDKYSFASIRSAQLYYEEGSVCSMAYDRQIGMTVRAVYGKPADIKKEYSVSGVFQDYEYVDLGLSVKWATANIGASNPKYGGDLISWGEVEPKDDYSWSTYKFSGSNRPEVCTKYNKIDVLDELEPIDDAATHCWGTEWRTPSIEEWGELIDNCDWVNYEGYMVGTSKINSNTIILSRITGQRDDEIKDNRQEDGYYWTSTRDYADIHKAYEYIFRPGYFFVNAEKRYVGHAIRPVSGRNYDKEYTVTGSTQDHEYVDLGLSVCWATQNLGAANPRQGGDLVAWGELESKDSYKWSTYRYKGEYRPSSSTKYNDNDGLSTLEAIDDAATVNWGTEWRIPTKDEWDELIENCEWKEYGGYLFGKSKINANKIVLSASTTIADNEYGTIENEGGFYWTSNNTSKERAYSVQYKLHQFGSNTMQRCIGQAIRPVTSNTEDSFYKPSFEESNREIRIFTLDGRLLCTFMPSNNRIQEELDNLSSGMYIVTTGTTTYKYIK